MTLLTSNLLGVYDSLRDFLSERGITRRQAYKNYRIVVNGNKKILVFIKE